MARTAFEHAVLSGCNVHAGAEFSDGTFPHNFWVSPNGNDGTGNGSWEAPYATIRRYIRQSVDGRGDRGLITGGSYPETIDIGSGSTSGNNTTGGYAKRDLQIIGDDSLHTGRIQIIGDGATAQATIKVQSGYGRGFRLAHVEVDTNTVARPALHLVTSDAGDLTATSSDEHMLLENVQVVSGGTPTAGILCEGTVKAKFTDLVIAGCVHGIVFAGSLNNYPDNLHFWNVVFQDNATADIATGTMLDRSAGTFQLSTCDLSNVLFDRPKFMDRGATPVTNYVNLSGTMVNCGLYDFVAARDVADDTLFIIPSNFIALGHSAAGVESIIGA